MNSIAEWYPGARLVIGIAEALGMITALLLAAWVSDKSLARKRAVLSHGLWQTALLGVIFIPVFVFVGHRLPWRLAVLASVPVESVEAKAQPSQSPPAPEVANAKTPHERQTQAENPQEESRTPVESASGIDKQKHGISSAEPALQMAASDLQISATPATQPEAVALVSTWDAFQVAVVGFLFAWGLGSVFLCIRLFHGWLQLRSLCRLMSPLDFSVVKTELASVTQMLFLRRQPAIFACPGVNSPFVAGVFSPRIVLPEELIHRSSSEQLRDILIHECAHIVRRDMLVRVLQHASLILFWIHPLVHLLNRRLDQSREEICDNHVLAHTDSPSYAETLLAVARLCHSASLLRGHLTMLPRHQNLEHRVADLLADNRDRSTRLVPKHRFAAGTALIATLALCTTVGLTGAAGEGDVAAAEPTKSPVRANDLQNPGGEEQPAKNQATGKIVGEAVNPDGSPAAGATVWAAQAKQGLLKRVETKSDADGRYSLAVPEGEWHVFARLGSKGGERRREERALSVKSGTKSELANIVLNERGTLRGKLTELETGKPVVGGKIHLDAGYVLTSGPNGEFETGGLTRTGHESFVKAAGRKRIVAMFDTTARSDTELEIAIGRGTAIVGRVTDQDGKPIAGAYVGRATSGNPLSISALYEPCDADGRFVYDGVAPEVTTELYANASGYFEGSWSGTTAKLDSKPIEVQFRLRPNPAENPNAKTANKDKWREVSGIIRQPDGKPAVDVLVRWGVEHYTTSIQRQTDKEGHFQMTVPDEANMLAILPNKLAPEFPKVAVGGDKSVEVTLKAGNTVTGRVLDDQGKPIEGVHAIADALVTGVKGFAGGVALWESGTFTDSIGNFTLKGVPERPSFLFFKDNLSPIRNYRPKLDANGNPEPVTMKYIGAIYGQALDPNGNPLRNFRVTVGIPRERRQGDRFEPYPAIYSGAGVNFTSPDGTFVLSGVGANSVHRITVKSNGLGDAVDDHVAAVSANRIAESKPLILKATSLRQLRVQTVTTDSKPISEARVALNNGDLQLDKSIFWGSDDKGVMSASARTAADGWADFPALSFSEATVLFQAPGYGRKHIPWRQGEEVLRAKLEPEVVISGEVLDATGAPVEKCFVRLSTGGDRPSSRPSANDQFFARIAPDDKGRFRIPELPAAEWTVSIFIDSPLNILHQEKVTLKAGQTQDLKIKLTK